MASIVALTWGQGDRSTLAQKIGQMTQAEIKSITPEQVREHYIGSVLNGGGSWPAKNKHATVGDWLALADAYYDASMATGRAVAAPRRASANILPASARSLPDEHSDPESRERQHATVAALGLSEHGVAGVARTGRLRSIDSH